MTEEAVARVAHAANREYRRCIGEDPGPEWDNISDHTKASGVFGVHEILENRITSAVRAHEGWLKFMEASGWVYCREKDEEKRTHPCIVPWDELPEEQRVKDSLFYQIVCALGPSVA